MNDQRQETFIPPSIEALYSAYSRRMYQRIYSLVGNREDAEDLTQEVFVRALRALPTLQTSRNLSGWLYRIATNLALDMLRHRRLIAWQSIDAQEWTLEASEACDPQTRYSGGVELASQALDTLPECYRAGLLLHAEGYSSAEIAQAQGKTADAMKSFLARARYSLEQRYQALQCPEEVST
jgi:RNA polymerase sigma-70 factor (ECF subfamily)